MKAYPEVRLATEPGLLAALLAEATDFVLTGYAASDETISTRTADLRQKERYPWPAAGDR
jgi:hypothetical protein